MNNDILRNIGNISRSLDSISNIEFKDIELEKGQYLYLSRVFENPGITQRQLSDLLCVDKTTTNRAISRLIEKKLVVKKSDLNNKKHKLLWVSNKGEELYKTLERESNYSTHVALSGLNQDEIIKMDKLLSKIARNVATDWQKVKKGYKRTY